MVGENGRVVEVVGIFVKEVGVCLGGDGDTDHCLDTASRSNVTIEDLKIHA